MPARSSRSRQVTGRRPPNSANQRREASTGRRRLGSWLIRTPLAQASPWPEYIRCERLAKDSWWKCARFARKSKPPGSRPPQKPPPTAPTTPTQGARDRQTAAKLTQAGGNNPLMLTNSLKLPWTPSPAPLGNGRVSAQRDQTPRPCPGVGPPSALRDRHPSHRSPRHAAARKAREIGSDRSERTPAGRCHPDLAQAVASAVRALP